MATLKIDAVIPTIIGIIELLIPMAMGTISKETKKLHSYCKDFV